MAPSDCKGREVLPMKLKIYAELAEKYTVPVDEVSASNPQQLIGIMRTWWPDLDKTFSDFDGLLIALEKEGKARFIAPLELKGDLTGVDCIHIIPDINGSGTFIAVVGLGFAAGSASALIVGAIINIAISFVISAIVQSLAPKPDMTNQNTGRPDDVPSYIFNGPINVTEEGYPVGYNFGYFRSGGTVISSGIYVEEIPV